MTKSDQLYHFTSPSLMSAIISLVLIAIVVHMCTWCLYASMDWLTIGSANASMSDRQQTITWINTNFYQLEFLLQHSAMFQLKQNLCFAEIAVENDICIMLAIDQARLVHMYSLQKPFIITVMSHKHHCVPIHSLLDCFFNNLNKVTN